MLLRSILLVIVAFAFSSAASAQRAGFVSVKGGRLQLAGSDYRFVGTNYWYGGLLGLEKDKKRGIERLRKELDFLKKNGVTNLRLMGGAEGSGLLNNVVRVGPPLQPENGKFDENVLNGLDIVLSEMGKRQMKAVIFLSNNWEWSGGFQQYLIWNGIVPSRWTYTKPDWEQLRDIVAKFYACEVCTNGYRRQAEVIIGRRNHVTGKKYTDDPAIMAWELANEPRPMRPSSNVDYRRWIKAAAAMIKSLDRDHLVTLGHEGWIGTESVELFETVHADPNVDYLTIHIWPKNWGWFAAGKMAEDFTKVVRETENYIAANASVAEKLEKPLVIEEFGLPRDLQSFEPGSPTSLRDRYYDLMLSHIGKGSVAGANFWAFGGTARPKAGQTFWREGDEYMGDPPMEEQGLNTVFDNDRSTWAVIRRHSARTAVK